MLFAVEENDFFYLIPILERSLALLEIPPRALNWVVWLTFFSKRKVKLILSGTEFLWVEIWNWNTAGICRGYDKLPKTATTCPSYLALKGQEKESENNPTTTWLSNTASSLGLFKTFLCTRGLLSLSPTCCLALLMMCFASRPHSKSSSMLFKNPQRLWGGGGGSQILRETQLRFFDINV